MDVKTGQILSMANLVATHPSATRPRRPARPRPHQEGSCRSGRTTPSTRRPNNLAVTPALRAGLGVQAGHLLGRAAGRPDQPQLRLHRARPDQAGRIDLPRRRAAPHRDADGDADPGPVLQHRDLGDRAGRGRAAPAQPGQGAGLRAADRAATSPASRPGCWRPRPSGSRPTMSRSPSGRSTPSAPSRCSMPTTPSPTAASSSHPSWSRRR